MERANIVSGSDRGRISSLLVTLGGKYPGGFAWLDRRLDDADVGKAAILGITVGPDLAALAIETPKGRRFRKLSTFIVDPRYRRCGFGARLITGLQSRWLRDEIDQIHVTVDQFDWRTQSFFRAHGFERLPRAFAAYGEDRADAVLTWRPDSASPSAAARN